jgi:hypothetical protein
MIRRGARGYFVLATRLTADELNQVFGVTAAQFLKRVSHSDYKALCEPYNKEGPYRMIAAGEKIREALKKAGYAPR